MGWRIRGEETAAGPPPGSCSLHRRLVSHQQEAEKKHVSSFLKFLTAVELIYNGVLVSGVRQSDSVGHIHISILFLILFPYRSLQSAEQSSPFNTVGSY